jgi:predicted dehydrogenase
MTTFNWAILGAGNISHKFAEGLQSVQGARLYCVASRSREKAREFAAAHHIPVSYGSYEELANDPNVDIVYIGTIHSLHCENTILCLNYKKAVLCEKPFALNCDEVRRMVASSRENNTFLMEALWTNFLPSIQKVKELLRDKVAGDPVAIRADFGLNRPFDEDHRFFKPHLGGGSLFEIGIYPVFLSLLLFGFPDECRAHVMKSPTGTDQTTGMFFSWKSGRFAQLASTFSVELDTEATIYCTQGKITLHGKFHMPTKLTVTTNETTREIPLEWKGNGYNYQAEEVMRAVADKKIESPSLTHEFSLTLMYLLETILTARSNPNPIQKPKWLTQ